MSQMSQSKALALIHLAGVFAPREMCGFILNDWSTTMIPNIAEDPSTTFEMHHQKTLDFYSRYQRRMLGMFHSHPGGSECPSATDTNNAPDGLRYYIVTTFSVTEWSIDGSPGSPRLVDTVYRSSAQSRQADGHAAAASS